VGWSVRREEGVVCAEFVGYLDGRDGESSAREFVAAVERDAVEVVFDVRQMSGYASAARRSWIRQLMPIRKQLRSIEVRGGNPLVRMGGSVVGAVLGVPVKTTR